MKRSKLKSHFVVSFEDTSILRKFSILFLVASIIPLSILLYTYLQSSANGYSMIPTDVLNNAMLIMIVGVFATYIAMRAMLIKVLEVSNENRRKLETLLGPKSIDEFTQEQNELVSLRRSFAVVTQQLEEVLRSLQAKK
jgi:hypothetical protein